MRQVQFLDIGGEYNVNIISSDNQQHLRIERQLPDGSYIIDSASGNYQTARQLSEALRDAIGYGPARDLLEKYGVDKDDPLMYLGVHN
jgi:predicted nuclease with TOPRIM domain